MRGAQEDPEMALEEEAAGKFPWEVPILKPPMAPSPTQSLRADNPKPSPVHSPPSDSREMDRAPDSTQLRGKAIPVATVEADWPRTVCCGRCLKESDIVTVSGRSNSCFSFSFPFPTSVPRVPGEGSEPARALKWGQSGEL